MKRGWILALISANLLVVVALVFAYPHLMVSPGPLEPAHAAISTDCFACHAPLRGADSSRCIACHAPPDIGLRSTKGVPLEKRTAKTAFHQQLIEQDCVACHSDHEGPKLVRGSRKTFSHALLRPEVRELCASCHTAPEGNLHRQVKGNCGQCHTQQGWKPATLDHASLFPLAGDHNAPCATCHVGDDYSRYTCYGCHEHSADRIRQKHVKEGIGNFENCVECHRSGEGESEGKHSGRNRGRD